MYENRVGQRDIIIMLREYSLEGCLIEFVKLQYKISK